MLILTTQQTYEYLTKVHGITQELCKHCCSHEIEVYQCDFDGCYECWMTLVDPKIEVRD